MTMTTGNPTLTCEDPGTGSGHGCHPAPAAERPGGPHPARDEATPSAPAPTSSDPTEATKTRRPRRNFADLAVQALEELGAPKTALEIQKHLGEGVPPASLHRGLCRDLRVVSTGPRTWGLRSWGLPEYKGMVQEMRQVLQERGEMPVVKLFQMMASAYGAGEETLRAAAAKPDFITAGGTIRLNKEPYRKPHEDTTGTRRRWNHNSGECGGNNPCPRHPNHGAEAMVQTEINASPASKALRLLAEWGIADTGASTLGELIEEIRVSEESRPEWDEITRIPLYELSNSDQSIQDALEKWATGLTGLERSILWDRMIPAESMESLQALANDHGVAYATAWNTQEALTRKLTKFVETGGGVPIRRRTRIIQTTIGVAMKEETANELLDLDPGTNRFRELLLRVAGPYCRDRGWLVIDEMRPSDPTEDLVQSVAENERLNERLVSYRLERWGLEPDKHWDWITRDPRVREFRGSLVRWGNTLGDQAVLALSDLGAPATSREIGEYLGDDIQPRSMQVAISRDPRLVKAGPKLWALRSWNLPEYLGLAHHMREVMEARGEMPLAELSEIMDKEYGAKEPSLRAAADKVGLVTRRGIVRLRDGAEAKKRGLTGTGET